MTMAELICASVLAIGMPNADYACKYTKTIVEASDQYDVDPYILTAMIHVESRWSPKAKSRAGACGLTQIIPKFSRKFGYVSCKELQRNPKLAIRKGAQILGYWTNVYAKGKIRTGLCAYNAGHRCKRGVKSTPGSGYSKKVMDYSIEMMAVFWPDDDPCENY
tara:strand:+ start:957 stop:1445 length:489 start_codon:yes stop_codon:yes gene_type:complete